MIVAPSHTPRVQPTQPCSQAGPTFMASMSALIRKWCAPRALASASLALLLQQEGGRGPVSKPPTVDAAGLSGVMQQPEAAGGSCMHRNRPSALHHTTTHHGCLHVRCLGSSCTYRTHQGAAVAASAVGTGYTLGGRQPPGSWRSTCTQPRRTPLTHRPRHAPARPPTWRRR
jgi:hypothetical protein